MSEPWVTIIGLHDGAESLPPASLAALENAQVIMGPARHLVLLPPRSARQIVWPVPFADGLPVLEGLRGQRVAVLVSGDPFWFGAGSVIAQTLTPGEWVALPSPSTFSLVAARLGWPLEATACLGLHAAPIARLAPQLMPGARAIVLMRDGASVALLAEWLTERGFGESRLTICEAMGGPRERLREAYAGTYALADVQHPVAVALKIAGDGRAFTWASGRADDAFAHDGQITKRPFRALALSALAPRAGETLWDIGGGSGSISVEWCLSHPSLRATCIEPRADRLAVIRENIARFGVAVDVIEGSAPEAFAGLSRPDAVFVGGGLSEELLVALEPLRDVRLVAHAVTLESEALLSTWAARKGGALMRIDIAQAEPLGRMRGWVPARPIVQWAGVL
ncbi:MAG: precorrin-6y C5,15-methyltransferase (decarboxylating) subunit CbiE [Paracoccus sp. (in: a-proteobacteria)]|nr:precorrin-6y C5,15-methyltransferase (decarboxylating) subunit CbiE [Paracoccus sp. (in: a-proteobacteria)]